LEVFVVIEAASQAGAQFRAPARILVVDDELCIRILLTELLSEAGLEAIYAADADEAVAILRQVESIALVLTDLNMPGSMNGLGLAQFVRRNRPRTKVVFLSSDASESALRDWGDGFLSKPCDFRSVIGTVTRVLAA